MLAEIGIMSFSLLNATFNQLIKGGT